MLRLFRVYVVVVAQHMVVYNNRVYTVFDVKCDLGCWTLFSSIDISLNPEKSPERSSVALISFVQIRCSTL